MVLSVTPIRHQSVANSGRLEQTPREDTHEAGRRPARPGRGLATLVVLFLLFPGGLSVRAQEWQRDFAAMPLGEPVVELNRTNAARVMLGAFKANPTVKALVFMPGATDELYFFDRDKARLTSSSPTLLDAVAAYTNQTRIRATFRAPFLLLHSGEDPLQTTVVVEDPKTLERLRGRVYAKKFTYEDQPWEFVRREVGWNLNINAGPSGTSEPSFHFYRHTLAGFGLNGMEALEAISMAGKTTVTVKKRALFFKADTRFNQRPESSADRVKRLLERKENEPVSKP